MVPVNLGFANQGHGMDGGQREEKGVVECTTSGCFKVNVDIAFKEENVKLS